LLSTRVLWSQRKFAQRGYCRSANDDTSQGEAFQERSPLDPEADVLFAQDPIITNVPGRANVNEQKFSPGIGEVESEGLDTFPQPGLLELS